MALLAGLLLIVVPTGVSAAGGGNHVLDQRCLSTYGFCWSTNLDHGDIYLVMQSPDHGGKYEVCVRPPQGKRACRPIRLRHRPPGQHGDVGFASRVDVQKSFGLSAKGEYQVTWRSYPDGLRFSPTLYFAVPLRGG